MPRINAPTVKQHRANVEGALVDAAERLLREGGPSALTASAVATQAGIARNSIYRYVDSIDDLRARVLERALPPWRDAVEQAVASAPTGRDKVLAWTRSNLDEAVRTGHAWLLSAAESASSSAADEILVSCRERSTAALRGAVDTVIEADLRELVTALVRDEVLAGLTRMDAGDAPDVVCPAVERCVSATLDALAG